MINQEAENSEASAGSSRLADLQNVLASARGADARYDHETAVAAYTAALDLPNLTLEEQYEILDGRLMTYRYWGDAVGFTEDLEALVALARQMDDKRFLAEAMAVRGFYWHYSGIGSPPLAFIEEATALAQVLADDKLLGSALLISALYAWQTGDTDSVWDTMHQSLAAARRSGDSDLILESSHLLAYIHVSFNQHEEAQRYAAEARALADASGHTYKQWYTYAVSSSAETDFAASRDYQEAATRAQKIANSKKSTAENSNGMALLLWRLGLYSRALAFATSAVEQAQLMGTLDRVGGHLDGVGRVYLAKGMLNEAERAFQRGFELTAVDKDDQAFHAYGLAEVALARKQPVEAAAYYQMTLQTFKTLEPSALAGLGAAYLAQGRQKDALAQTTKAVELLDSRLVIDEFPAQEIWWRHYQVLRAMKDEAAFDALDTARQSMMAAIETLSDEGLRRNYLNKVAVNRDITLTWTAEAAKHGRPLDSFTAHEPLAGNLREQFRRVVEIGGRLAAQHDPAALAGFIVDEFVEMSGAERVLLLLLDQEGQPQLSASYNPDNALALAGPLASARQPVRQHDVGTVPEGEVAELNQRSSIALPLISQGRSLGLLYGDIRQIFGRFDEADLNLLVMFANQAASALENADLVSNLEERVAQCTAELAAAKGEAELAREDAEHANEAKSAFMSNMSHELRTPLNAIIGFTRIVQRKATGILPDRQTDNLDKVLTSGEHLLGLINTILDIAKIEAGRMDVVNSRFQIGQLIESAATMSQPLLKPGVDLHLDVVSSIPEINSDQDKIKQILLNLLSNAAKFTHEGSITASAYKNEENIIIDVTDTGIGMNEAALGRVFEEFQQADATTRNKYGGTGLGMPISKHLAQLLGGDLTVASAEGEGSTFTLTLPIEEVESR